MKAHNATVGLCSESGVERMIGRVYCCLHAKILNKKVGES